jgi:hypothetical protein
VARRYIRLDRQVQLAEMAPLPLKLASVHGFLDKVPA